MHLSKSALLLTSLHLFTFTLAQTPCTQSSASLYNDPNDVCGPAALARDDTGCVQKFCDDGGTEASLHACFCLAGNLADNCGSTSGTKVRRAGFTCEASETCYVNPVDDGLFCLDESTGDYVGEGGDSGNVNTGAYTAAPGGGTTSVASSKATSTKAPQSTASTKDSTISSSTTPTGSSTVSATKAPTDAKSSAAVASAVSTAGMGKVSAEALVGAVGLVAGLVL